jgi:DNA-binding transcriptional regulator LsrR (DeoR family)
MTLVVEAYEAGKDAGLTDNEIATELGCDRTTLCRAREKARKRGLR